MRWFHVVVALGSLGLWSTDTRAGSWPQFHGPNAAGLADSDAKLPAQIGPTENVVWKIPLPPGHSSPVVHGDRIFVTAVRAQTLLTLGIDRSTGKILWQAQAPHHGLEKIHQIGSHAQSSPATDGQLVVSLFGSSGVCCYDRDGQEM